MTNFSERYNLVPQREIQFDNIDTKLFNRLWNIFYSREYDDCSFSKGNGKIEKPEQLLDRFGLTYVFPDSHFERNNNIKKCENFLRGSEWYVMYDFIENYVSLYDNATERKLLEKEVNLILEQEKSGYRMIKGLIAPITNSSELDSIKKAISTKFSSVNTHFEKALALYSNRNNPDYENSIKESISAVEAICCIITGTTGAQATLGATLKKLESSGVYIHSAMKNAFSSLYGYTSDENGIRHGGVDFTNAPAEDAKYMLVSCSAFVNYLIEKWSQVN